MSIEEFVNGKINTTEFNSYCDTELYEIVCTYVEKNIVEKVNSVNKKFSSILSPTQARGILNISKVCIEDSTKNDLHKFIKDRYERALKEEEEFNKKSESFFLKVVKREIWEDLKTLVDENKDILKSIANNKKTPKMYIDSINFSDLTSKEQKAAKSKIFNYLLKNLFVHFYSHYIYLENIQPVRR